MASHVQRLVVNRLKSMGSLKNLSSFSVGKGKSSTSHMNWKVIGASHSINDDFQYRCLTMDWFRLWGLIISVYAACALFFASITYTMLLSDEDHFSGDLYPSMRLLEQSFWLSVGHIITIGYGNLHPISCKANILVTAQFFIGILLSSILLGIVFAKAELPTVKILFSNHCIVTTRNGVRQFIFRVANTRGNHLVAPDVRLSAFTHIETEEGESVWIAQPMEVALAPLIAPSFNMVHKIDDSSPLKDYTNDQLMRMRFSVSMSATDNYTFQTIYAVKFYEGSTDLLANVRFADVFRMKGDNTVFVDLDKFHEVESLKEHLAIAEENDEKSNQN